jgi:hypothetical protein
MASGNCPPIATETAHPETLRDGMRVRVDGAAGTVEILR